MSGVANNKQVAGSHYQVSIQPWDYIHSNGIGYLAGNIIKYVSRYKSKNGLEDLRKAQHYLEKLIEEELQNELAAQKLAFEYQKASIDTFA